LSVARPKQHLTVYVAHHFAVCQTIPTIQ
jgi:hypothetical protein